MKPAFFSGLRLRLTLLYLLAGLVLVAAMGGSTYALLADYFRARTEAALFRRLADELWRIGAPVPADLVAADRETPLAGLPGSLLRYRLSEEEGHEVGQDEEPEGSSGEGRESGVSEERRVREADSAVPARLLDADGRPWGSGGPAGEATPDRAAVAAAFERGQDLRTVDTGRDGRIRVLTYRLDLGYGPALVQVARPLTDQERIMGQLLTILVAVGATGILFVGTGSWWLAGRSLRPAQVAWDRQQTFIAAAGHELRAPLTLLRASAEVALRQTATDDTDQQELLGDVLQECDHLTRLVDDMLLLSRLDTGRLELKVQAVDLAEFFASLDRQVRRLAREREVHLTVGAVSGAVWADPARLRQVFLILIDNALRFTSSGGTISLGVRPNGRGMHLTVADTGRGIPPEALPHVFERFYQVDPAQTGQNTGLGLAIAKALVEAHRGSITLTSRVGQGTRVEITWPAV